MLNTPQIWYMIQLLVHACSNILLCIIERTILFIKPRACRINIDVAWFQLANRENSEFSKC